MGSLAIARSNAWLYTNARLDDIVLKTQGNGARVLFGTHGDTYSAMTIDSNLTTFTDAVALSNPAGEVWLAAASNAAGTPALRVHGDVFASNLDAAAAAALFSSNAATHASNQVQWFTVDGSNAVVPGNLTVQGALVAAAQQERVVLVEGMRKSVEGLQDKVVAGGRRGGDRRSMRACGLFRGCREDDMI